MGTRHLIAVQLDGQYRVAQYGQWGGYPAGQGKTVLDFLGQMNRDEFAAKVRCVEWITDEESRARWVEFGASPDADFVSVDIARQHDDKYPENSRDTGGDILALVSDSEPGLKLKNSIDFAGDSLFCEWAYVIDLDANTFEVYRGFQHAPRVGQRFSDVQREQSDYAPIALVKSYSLDSLPSVEQLVADCDGTENE